MFETNYHDNYIKWNGLNILLENFDCEIRSEVGPTMCSIPKTHFKYKLVNSKGWGKVYFAKNN